MQDPSTPPNKPAGLYPELPPCNPFAVTPYYTPGAGKSNVPDYIPRHPAERLVHRLTKDDNVAVSQHGQPHLEAIEHYCSLCIYVEHQLQSGKSLSDIISDPEDQVVLAFIIYVLRIPIDVRCELLYKALDDLKLSPRVFNHFDTLPLDTLTHLCPAGDGRQLRHITRAYNIPFLPPGKFFSPFRKYLLVFQSVFPAHYTDGSLISNFFEKITVPKDATANADDTDDEVTFPNRPVSPQPSTSQAIPNPLSPLPYTAPTRRIVRPDVDTQGSLPLYPSLVPLSARVRRCLAVVTPAPTERVPPIPAALATLPLPNSPDSSDLSDPADALYQVNNPDSPVGSLPGRLSSSPSSSLSSLADMAQDPLQQLIQALGQLQSDKVTARATLFPSPATFDGTDKSKTLGHWQRFLRYVEFQQQTQGANIPVDELLKLFGVTLAPPASVWLSGETGITSLEELGKRFVAYFSPWGSTPADQERTWAELKLNLMTDQWDAWISNLESLANILGKSDDQKKLKLTSVLPPFLRMVINEEDDYSTIKKKVKCRIPHYQSINKSSSATVSAPVALMHPTLPLPPPPVFAYQQQRDQYPPARDFPTDPDVVSFASLAKSAMDNMAKMANAMRQQSPSPSRRNGNRGRGGRGRGDGGRGGSSRGRGQDNNRSRSAGDRDDRSEWEGQRNDYNRGSGSGGDRRDGNSRGRGRGGRRSFSNDSGYTQGSGRGFPGYPRFNATILDEDVGYGSSCYLCMVKDPSHDPIHCPYSGPLLRSLFDTPQNVE